MNNTPAFKERRQPTKEELEELATQDRKFGDKWTVEYEAAERLRDAAPEMLEVLRSWKTGIGGGDFDRRVAAVLAKIDGGE